MKESKLSKYEEEELKDEDTKRDTQHIMSWCSFFGMFFYPIVIMLAEHFGYDESVKVLSDIAPTYFVSAAGIIAAYFGSEAYRSKK